MSDDPASTWIRTVDGGWQLSCDGCGETMTVLSPISAADFCATLNAFNRMHRLADDEGDNE